MRVLFICLDLVFSNSMRYIHISILEVTKWRLTEVR